MNSLGKSLIIIGVAISAIGVGLVVFSRLKIPFLGRLPGDILIQKKNFTFYFPLATSLIFSIVLSFIFTLFQKCTDSGNVSSNTPACRQAGNR